MATHIILKRSKRKEGEDPLHGPPHNIETKGNKDGVMPARPPHEIKDGEMSIWPPHERK